MDTGDLAGLAGAAGAVGAGLGNLSQDAFREQTDAANSAQRAALASQAQKAASERQAASLANTNQNESANRSQKDTFHADDMGIKNADLTLKSTVADHTMSNQDANTGLRASEVSMGNAEKAQTIAASKELTPLRGADLKARAAGIDSLPTGVTKPMVDTLTKEWQQSNKDVAASQRQLDALGKNHFMSPAQQKAVQGAQSALSQAQARAASVKDRLDGMIGLNKSGGIAPGSDPTDDSSDDGDEGDSGSPPAPSAGISPSRAPARSASPARSSGTPSSAAPGAPMKVSSPADLNALASGALYIGPDGVTRVKP